MSRWRPSQGRYPDVVPGKVLHIQIPTGNVGLPGDLNLPASPRGVVLFAHGSGSSRRSPRNRYVAHVLNEIGLITLLFDLLTGDEESSGTAMAELRFDIKLLAQRLAQATNWVIQQPFSRELKIGYFGASTGAAAAFVAATEFPQRVAAIVSRGGRPDLAGMALSRVQAPTLLIVGGEDTPVIRLNEQAMEQLRCRKHLEIIPGATHLFEEPGTLEQVARVAREWFELHLQSRGRGIRAA